MNKNPSNKIIHVILCGGAGKRLWPLSRTSMPKPFISFNGKETFFNKTINKFSPFIDERIIVTHENFSHIVQGELINYSNSHILLEPDRKNTALPILLAAFHVNPNDILLVTPADHEIKEDNFFSKTVTDAINAAKKNKKLITFGIAPTFPSTEYGYIKSGNETNFDNIVHAESFHEKPELNKAKEYMDSNQYFWNSGMFCFQASVLATEMKKYAPELFKQSENLYKTIKSNKVSSKFDAKLMGKIPNISIDYALMEKSNNILMIKSKMDWYDLGNFEQLQTLFKKDDFNNTQTEKIVTENAKNNIIISDHRVIAIADVDDLVVVDTSDALLITKRNGKNFQKLLPSIKESYPEVINYPKVERRPWGSFKVINDGMGFKVKEINVLPGQQLSLQKHKHRSEKWVVVEGTATVTLNNDTLTLNIGETISINPKDIHRLANFTESNLKIIEVQLGDYLEEDDIIRIDDEYNRAI